MRYKYSVSPQNQLIVSVPKQKPLKPKGNFQINQNNQLEYWFNEPQNWRQLYNLPQKIVFEGKWQLDSNHDLELILNKTRDQSEGNRLTLKGEIISAENNIIAFEIVTRREVTSTFSILKLTGTWQADEFNRLTFEAAKKDAPDTLTFKAAWQVNKNQQIEYTYEKTNLRTKTKVKQTLIFEGFWEIDSEHKISYILSHNLDSQFDFRVFLENPNIYPQQNAIKYRLGIGVKQPKRARFKVITLYGQWKFNRNLSLIFSMDYGAAKVQKLEFGAEVTFQRNRLILSLKNTEGEPLGLTLTYTYRMINRLEPQVFIRLKSYQKELGVEAGFFIPF